MVTGKQEITWHQYIDGNLCQGDWTLDFGVFVPKPEIHHTTDTVGVVAVVAVPAPECCLTKPLTPLPDSAEYFLEPLANQTGLKLVQSVVHCSWIVNPNVSCEPLVTPL